MSEPTLETFYKGWEVYQHELVKAIGPLSAEQLALSSAAHMWSVGTLVVHIIAARAGWMHMWMHEGSADMAVFDTWDAEGAPARSAAELVSGLAATWQMIADMLAQRTPADLATLFEDPYPAEGRAKKSPRTRQWIIWHVLEHDIHHSGEISMTLGMHGLTGLDL